jgi:hypothetical protein
VRVITILLLLLLLFLLLLLLLLLLLFCTARYNLLFKQLHCTFDWLFLCVTYIMDLLSDDLHSRVIRAARGPALYYTLLILCISYITVRYFLCHILSTNDTQCRLYTTCSTNLWHLSHMFRP